MTWSTNCSQGYTDEPVKKIIMGVEEARMVKLDRWKLFVEKNDDALRITNDEEVENTCLFLYKARMSELFDKVPNLFIRFLFLTTTTIENAQ